MKAKKLLALLCAAALTASCTACGKDTEKDQSSASESKAETQSQAEGDPAEEGDILSTPYETSCDGSAKVTVSGDKFMVGDSEIWFNGVNTPWNNWNDFGGNFNFGFWQEHFEKLHKSGVNACRIWISCNGDVGMKISPDGSFEGAETVYWEDLDNLFFLAENYQIYVMATVQSFDHYKDTNQNYESWRTLIQSPEKTDEYVDNYIVPLVKRYDSCDYLWSIDLCNEPDWVIENAECGKLDWQGLQEYYAKASSAIHANSDVLVTVGMGMIKYNSDTNGNNIISDTALQSLDTGKYDSSLAYVDFWSTHWYSWMMSMWGKMFEQTPEEYGLPVDRPTVIGEMPASDEKMGALADAYESAYNNGYQGVFAWTSNGVDDCGGWQDCQPAIEKMMGICENKIFPIGKK